MSLKINFKNIVNQGINYSRYYIQSLVKYNKPIIVVGKFVGKSNSARTKYTFVNIKPYVTDNYYSYELTQHINIYKSYFDEYYGTDVDNYINKEFVIVCKPYFYKDEKDIQRASLDPTNELLLYGFPSFKLLSESEPASKIPWDKVIDFRKEFNYKFACPINSKYCRYDDDGNPIKNFIYIESINLDNINSTRKTDLDEMIKDALGCLPSNRYSDYNNAEMTNRNKKGNKQFNFYKKTNVKSLMKSTAKRRLNDLKHNYQDNLVNNYSLFSQ